MKKYLLLNKPTTINNVSSSIYRCESGHIFRTYHFYFILFIQDYLHTIHYSGFIFVSKCIAKISGVLSNADDIIILAGVFKLLTKTSEPSGFQPLNVASSVDCSYVRMWHGWPAMMSILNYTQFIRNYIKIVITIHRFFVYN